MQCWNLSLDVAGDSARASSGCVSLRPLSNVLWVNNHDRDQRRFSQNPECQLWEGLPNFPRTVAPQRVQVVRGVTVGLRVEVAAVAVE